MNNLTQRKSKAFWIILGTITVFAFLLRIWGIGYGLPYEYHVDEVQYVRQAASMGEHGLEPTNWQNPPLLKYVLLAEYALIYVVGRLLGLYSSPSVFGAVHSVDPSLLYLFARGTNAFLGAMTVLVVGSFGKIIFNRRVGLLGAWFLAVCFIAVRDSHFATNDILVTLLASITLFASLKILLQNNKKWYIVAGLGLGLGFATKYSAIVSVVPIVLAHILSKKFDPRNLSRLGIPNLALCFIMGGCSSILASPFFILSPKAVFNDFYNMDFLPGQVGFDGWQIDPSGGYIYYVRSMLWGLGWGLSLLAVLGVIIAMVHWSKEAAVILSLPIALYAILGRERMYFARFMIPAIPPLLLWSARILDGFCNRWIGGRNQFLVPILLALTFTAQPLADSVKLDSLWQKDDTRTLAKRWIEDNIPAGSKIAVDWPFYGPPLSTNNKVVPYSKHEYDVESIDGSGLDRYTVAWYKANGFNYLIASSFIYDIPLLSEEKQISRVKFYASLDNDLTLVEQVLPGKSPDTWPFVFDEIYGPAVTLWERQSPGPTIKIYKLSK